MPAAFHPVQHHRTAPRRRPRLARYRGVVGRGRQLLDDRLGFDAVAGHPVGRDRLRAGHDVLTGQFSMPRRSPLQYQAGQPPPAQPPAGVGFRGVAGAHHDDHARAQQRLRGEAPAVLQRSPGDQEQAGHREQGVPRDMLGEACAVRHAREEHRPRLGRALGLEVGAELGEEERVV
jgi:hypothetical protein